MQATCYVFLCFAQGKHTHSCGQPEPSRNPAGRCDTALIGHHALRNNIRSVLEADGSVISAEMTDSGPGVEPQVHNQHQNPTTGIIRYQVSQRSPRHKVKVQRDSHLASE
ncbi:hypothetical protein O181_007693 [Austropuccinia psidii MF-1]|uniref:Uncharacterized protein n=1 Tax=Austropuccinia psidii MF-1 TaxID=1389203 RepID=A0A9Q3GHU3_9BASI|nr:hypothetical protein [Austropuccinia psidii MF-1]